MASPMSIIRKRLEEKREQLSILTAEISLLESMLAEAKGEPDPSQPKQRAKRSSVKSYVLELLDQVGEKGLNAAIAVSMATQEGRDLDRNSVSSLLSRLKNEGLLVYDGDKYRLKSRMSTSEDQNRSLVDDLENVHLHPASGRSTFS